MNQQRLLWICAVAIIVAGLFLAAYKESLKEWQAFPPGYSCLEFVGYEASQGLRGRANKGQRNWAVKGSTEVNVWLAERPKSAGVQVKVNGISVAGYYLMDSRIHGYVRSAPEAPSGVATWLLETSAELRGISEATVEISLDGTMRRFRVYRKPGTSGSVMSNTWFRHDQYGTLDLPSAKRTEVKPIEGSSIALPDWSDYLAVRSLAPSRVAFVEADY